MSGNTDQASSAVTAGEHRSSAPWNVFVRWLETRSDAAFAYLLLIPVLLVLSVVAFWPLLRTFQMSLHANALYSAKAVGEFVGLKNYIMLFTGEASALLVRPFLPVVVWNSQFPFFHGFENLFVSALSVTFIFTAVSVFFETLIGFGQALVLDQDFRGRRWARLAIILPWAVPIVIQGMVFFLIFQPNIGFLVGTPQDPSLLNYLGFSYSPLSNPVESTIIVIVADVWKTSAFMALLILAGLQSIDRSLYDVAKVSGASRWQQFKMITLPLVFPTVMVAMLFRTIAALRIYGLIATISSCSTVPSLSCLVVTSFSSHRYGSAATIAFVTAAIIGVVVSIYIVKYAGSDTGGV